MDPVIVGLWTCHKTSGFVRQDQPDEGLAALGMRHKHVRWDVRQQR